MCCRPPSGLKVRFVFGYAWGLLVDTPTQNAPLRHMPPNLNIQNPKFKIQLFNGRRPGEKRAKARGEEPCYARW